jgi:hypothetical protein
MGDRSPLTLDICGPLTEAYARAVADVFENHTAHGADDKTIAEIMQPGTTWLSADDMSLGTAEDIAADLMALMDGDADEGREPQQFPFTVWQDPKYEYPGTLHRYAPGGALFTADCDADGNVTATADTIRAAVTATRGRDDLIAALSSVYGEQLT